MLLLAGGYAASDDAKSALLAALYRGDAVAKLREWVHAQGGDEHVVDHPEIMPQACLVVDLPSPCGGYVAAIDAMEVGMAAVALGAGRQRKGEGIDHAVGMVLRKKVGERVETGEPLLTVHANEEGRLREAQARLLRAYRWSNVPVTAAPLIRRIIR
jgi:pyrimidine-nucleoside phosphorylase